MEADLLGARRRRARPAPPGGCRWRIPGASSRRGGPCPGPARPRPGRGVRTRGRPEGRAPWPPSRPRPCPERFILAVTRTLLADSAEPEPVGWPASAASAHSMRRRLLRRKAGSLRTSPVPFPFGGRCRSASTALPTPPGSWGGTCRHLPDQAVPSAVSGPKAASAAAPGCRAACRKSTGMTSGIGDSRKVRLSGAASATTASFRSGLRA